MEKKKAEYVELMKNKIAQIHKQAEEKRAMIEARRGEEVLKAEELAAKYRASGTAPKKLFGFMWFYHIDGKHVSDVAEMFYLHLFSILEKKPTSISFIRFYVVCLMCGSNLQHRNIWHNIYTETSYIVVRANDILCFTRVDPLTISIQRAGDNRWEPRPTTLVFY